MNRVNLKVMVSWEGRWIASHIFKSNSSITIGSSPQCDVCIPNIGLSHEIIQFKNLAQIKLPHFFEGELVSSSGSNQSKDIEIIDLNDTPIFASGVFLQIHQVLKLKFKDQRLCVFVNYVEAQRGAPSASLLEFSKSEKTGIMGALASFFALWMYFSLMTPVPLQAESRQEQKIRMVFLKPPKFPPKVTQVRPIKKRVEKVAVKQRPETKKIRPQNSGRGKHGHVVSKPNPKTVGVLGAIGKTKGATVSDVLEMALATRGQGGQVESGGFGRTPKFKGTGPEQNGYKTVSMEGGVGTFGRRNGYNPGRIGGLAQKAKYEVRVDDSAAEIIGQIDREAIRRVIMANRSSLRSCYERALQSNSILHGKLVLNWDIEDRGRVTRVKIQSDTLADAAVGKCVERVIGALRFPSPPVNQVARVTYPFIFTSQ